MSYVGYGVDVTVTNGQGSTSLGGGTLPNRRLVMRWLRRQALRLADGHGYDIPPGSLRLPVRDVDPVLFHGTDAPEALRAWAADDERQERALSALESGLPARLTVVDPAVGLHVTLAGWPIRSARAVGDAFFPLPSGPKLTGPDGCPLRCDGRTGRTAEPNRARTTPIRGGHMPAIAPPEADEPEGIESDTDTPDAPQTDDGQDGGTAVPVDLVGALLAA